MDDKKVGLQTDPILIQRKLDFQDDIASSDFWSIYSEYIYECARANGCRPDVAVEVRQDVLLRLQMGSLDNQQEEVVDSSKLIEKIKEEVKSIASLQKNHEEKVKPSELIEKIKEEVVETKEIIKKIEEEDKTTVKLQINLQENKEKCTLISKYKEEIKKKREFIKKIEDLEKCRWISINPMIAGEGIHNPKVREFRHILLDSYELPIEDQYRLYRNSRLPIAALVNSKGMSLHAIVKIEAGTDFDIYNHRVDFLYEVIEKLNKVIKKYCDLKNINELIKKNDEVLTNINEELKGNNADKNIDEELERNINDGVKKNNALGNTINTMLKRIDQVFMKDTFFVEKNINEELERNDGEFNESIKDVIKKNNEGLKNILKGLKENNDVKNTDEELEDDEALMKSLNEVMKKNDEVLKNINEGREKKNEVIKDRFFIVNFQKRKPSRFSRIPGIFVGNVPQYLVATNLGLPSWREWENCIRGFEDSVYEPPDTYPEIPQPKEDWRSHDAVRYVQSLFNGDEKVVCLCAKGALHRFDSSKAKFRTFLVTIIKYCIKDALRREYRHRRWYGSEENVKETGDDEQLNSIGKKAILDLEKIADESRPVVFDEDGLRFRVIVKQLFNEVLRKTQTSTEDIFWKYVIEGKKPQDIIDEYRDKETIDEEGKKKTITEGGIYEIKSRVLKKVKKAFKEKCRKFDLGPLKFDHNEMIEQWKSFPEENRLANSKKTKPVAIDNSEFMDRSQKVYDLIQHIPPPRKDEQFVILINDQNPDRNEWIPLEKNGMTIGSGQNSDIILNDEGVSELHARLKKSGNRWIVQDQSSRNYTRVNGEIVDSEELISYDVIQIASLDLAYFVS